MSFLGKINVSLALLMAFSSFAVAAKSSSGKVVDKLGDASIQKSTKIGEWTEISVGNRVKEKDQIRTGIESHVSIALSDGSSIMVQENSLVEFTTLQAEDGIQTALTDIKTGKVRFDAQKQHSGGSFKFKTATATAAIRGTDGSFGKTIKDKATFISLGSGNALFKHNQSGAECSVAAGQTGVFRGNSKKCTVIDASSSGNERFVAALDSLLDNEAITDDQLGKAIQKLDTATQNELKAVSSNTCSFEPIEDTIMVNSVTIKGSCAAGLSLELAGTTIQNAENGFEHTISWSSATGGIKKFKATCSASLQAPCSNQKKAAKPQLCPKKVSFTCGLLQTFYKIPSQDSTAADSLTQDTTSNVPEPVKKLTVTTASPVEVCNPGSVTIEGTFDQTDPRGTLFVKLGKIYKSRNLVQLSANGVFSHTISINDNAGNWNVDEAEVEYNGASGNSTQTVRLNVNKTCPQVNLKRPKLKFSNSSPTACVATFALADANDDIVIVQKQVDHTTIRELTYKQNSNIDFTLTPGFHTYTVKATDQAGNQARISKRLGCFPTKKIPVIDIVGGPYEHLRPPPAPPQTTNTTILKTLRFRINNVVNLDPSQIKLIKVTQDGTQLMKKTTDQIDDLDFSQQVTLSRNSESIITIYVEMMSGKKVSATKRYEVN